MRAFFELDKWFAPILLPAAAALLAFSFSTPAQAAKLQGKNGTYVIAADSGYGIDDCISQSFDCGSVVATAWCEAHGHGAARAFGPASDVTFATLVSSTKNVKAVGPDSIIIDCEE